MHRLASRLRARVAWPLAAAAAALLLAGCGTTLSRRTPDTPAEAAGAVPAALPASSDRDGPPLDPPPDLERVPDAEPRVEPIRPSGPNKPYQAFGTVYVPLVDDVRVDQRGLASWYGRKFHGRRTASGETYNMYAMTAAHRTLPIPSYARVRNPANGRSVVVRVNDRGPFHAARVIDLSYVAALRLGVANGTAPVEVRRLTHDEIRAGTWREDDGGAASAVAAAAHDGTGRARDTSSTRGPDAAVATTFAVSGAARDDVPAASASAAAPDAVPVPLPLLPVGAGAAEAPMAPSGPAAPQRALTAAARGHWVQLGAFREADAARELQQRVGAQLGWLAPLLAVFDEAAVHRVQAGPYPTREQAAGVLRRIRAATALTPLLVERR